MCLEMVLYNHAQCDRHRLDLEELTRSHILDLDQQASHLQVRLHFIKVESHPVRQAAGIMTAAHLSNTVYACLAASSWDLQFANYGFDDFEGIDATLL